MGRQELEIVMGNEHISFTTSKIGSLVDVQSSADPEGLRIFYYLVQVKLWFRVLIDLCKVSNCACSFHTIHIAAIGLSYRPRQGCMFNVSVSSSVVVRLGRKGNTLKFVGIIASL